MLQSCFVSEFIQRITLLQSPKNVFYQNLKKVIVNQIQIFTQKEPLTINFPAHSFKNFIRHYFYLWGF